MVYLDNSHVIVETENVYLDGIEDFSLNSLFEIATLLDKHGEITDDIKEMILFVFEKIKTRDVSPGMVGFKSMSEEVLNKRLDELIEKFEL